MDLVTFIENRYQELTLEMHGKERYPIKLDAEIKSAHQILNGYRLFLKWALMPKIFFNFIQVKLGIKTPPKPVLVNMARETKLKEEAEKAKQSKEVLSLVT